MNLSVKLITQYQSNITYNINPSSQNSLINKTENFNFSLKPILILNLKEKKDFFRKAPVLFTFKI
jgi:hypothetical protein